MSVNAGFYSRSTPTFALKTSRTFGIYRISCFFLFPNVITFFFRALQTRAPSPGGSLLLPQEKNRKRKREIEKWRTSGKSARSLCPAVSTIRGKRRYMESFSSSCVYLQWTPEGLRPTGLSQRTEKFSSKYDSSLTC